MPTFKTQTSISAQYKMTNRLLQNNTNNIDCHSCGASLPVENKFCGRCGIPALKADHDKNQISANLGVSSRRNVSIIYADLVNSTDLVRSIDPEQYEGIIRRYHQCCIEVITDFGGKITEIAGDGVSALFTGSEKFTESAIRAGNELINSIATLRPFETPTGKIKLAIRIGICSGEALLQPNHDNDTLSVLGQPFVEASRLQTFAKPGQILLCHNTYLLASRIFELRKHPRELLRSKGYEDWAPDIWRFISLNEAKFTFAAQDRNNLSPLIGREMLMSALLSDWAMVTTKKGQVAYISGAAGMGKSRVVEELQQRVKRLTPDVIILRYQCSKFATRSPLYPIWKQVIRLSQIMQQDPSDIVTQKLNNLLKTWHINPAPVTPKLLPFLSEHKSGKGVTSKQIRQAVRACTQMPLSFARTSPIMVLIEDIHWIDKASMRLLDDSINRISKRQLYILATYRPDETNVSILNKPYIHHHHLSGLSKSKASDLIDAINLSSKLSDQKKQLVIDNAAGIPLFLEELALNAALDSQTNDTSAKINTPTRLFDLLLHRYDNLDPTTKAIAQIGSVMGLEFEFEAIQSILELDEQLLDTSINKLVENDQIYNIDSTSKVYRFKHALIRDAIYDNTLNQDKFRLHKATHDYFSSLNQIGPRMVIRHIEHHKKMMQFYTKYS